MGKILSGITNLDNLIDSLYVGDNVVWEVEAGTSPELFVQEFIRQSFSENQRVIYVSYNKSPHSILLQFAEIPAKENLVLLDCFTAGKGKNDRTFLKFYENGQPKNVYKVEEPRNIEKFTEALNSIEEAFPTGKRYIFDSLTGMQDLWSDEDKTYKFFTYMCPRLYDLGTVAYWILEKEAHSQAFKANLRHITQLVFDLYKRKDKLYIKALKLERRSNREAFKPRPYEIDRDSRIFISPARKEPAFDIGTKIKQLRVNLSMSQKELADRVGLTPSFISQLENNQISPSLNSFVQICNALGIAPAELFGDKYPDAVNWLIRKERTYSNIFFNEDGLKGYRILKNGAMSGALFIMEPHTMTEQNFIPDEGKKLLYLVSGNVSVVIEKKEKILRPGDSLYLKEEIPSLWKNEGGEKAELLLVCS